MVKTLSVSSLGKNHVKYRSTARPSGGAECFGAWKIRRYILFFKIFFEMNMSVSWYCMLGLFVPGLLTSFCSRSRNKRHIDEKEDEERCQEARLSPPPDQYDHFVNCNEDERN
jgi:hypothetical protein